MKAFTTFAVVSSLVSSTLAHGFVSGFTVDGKLYKGPKPWDSKGSFAIRQIANTEPNHVKPTGKKDTTADVACGRGAAKKGASVMAEAKPGSKLAFMWDAGNGDAWPHQQGPIILYAAKCNGDCSKVDATTLDWFKIDQYGKKPQGGNNWYQTDLNKKGVFTRTATIPADMPNGDYLFRHEIIALHLGDQTNGAELYPTCVNIRISGGSSSGTPSPTVKFPGAYKTTDAGIHINIWDTAKKAYPYPGPAIVKFSGGGAAAASVDDSTGSGNTDSGSTGSTDDNSSGSGSGSGSSDDNSGNSGSGSTDGGDEDCSEDGNDTTGGSTDPSDSGSGSGSGSGTGSGATKTVTVTVTVTATPTGKSSSDYKKRDLTPLKIRRSRAHNANAIHRS